MNVLVFGAVMQAVKYQEELISKIFAYAEALMLVLVTNARSLAGRLKGKRLPKLYRLMSWIERIVEITFCKLN